MGRQSQQHLGAEQGACLGDGQVVLPDVEDIGSDEGGDVCPVVDGEELPVLAGDFGKHFQRCDLRAGVEPLVPQLDDVHPTVIGGVQEVAQVALQGPCGGAQIEPCVLQFGGAGDTCGLTVD